MIGQKNSSDDACPWWNHKDHVEERFCVFFSLVYRFCVCICPYPYTV